VRQAGAAAAVGWGGCAAAASSGGWPAVLMCRAGSRRGIRDCPSWTCCQLRLSCKKEEEDISRSNPKTNPMNKM
jgi:hypothetical protein